MVFTFERVFFVYPAPQQGLKCWGDQQPEGTYAGGEILQCKEYFAASNWIFQKAVSSLRVSQPWTLGLLIIRGRYAAVPGSPPSGDCDPAYQREPSMGQRGTAPPLLRDRTECCCLPPKLNDPGSFCFCRVAWPRAKRGDLIGIRGCAVCLRAWQLLELEALGPPHSLEFQRVREAPQRPGLPFPFYSVCVHCELWPSLMKTY